MVIVLVLPARAGCRVHHPLREARLLHGANNFIRLGW